MENLSLEVIESILKDRAVRQRVTHESHYLFFHIYFHHYVAYPIADFQKDIFRITENDSIKLACIVAFRGSSKSTLVTLSYCLWSILGVQQKKFVLIICQTQAQAKQHMSNVKNELENNEPLKNDFGPFREEPSTTEWTIGSLVFPQIGARIMVVSVDQSIRGARHNQHRPDVIILDDVEDVNSVRTYDSRQKMYDWFSREVVPLGNSENTRIIMVGNLVHNDSLMMRLIRQIQNKERKGVYRKIPLIDKHGRCLWPEKFDTEEKIENLRQSVGNNMAWCMEYLLVPVSDSSQVIQSEWITYYDTMPAKTRENKYRGAYIGIDLAISEKDRADYTAMVSVCVFGWGEDMKIYVVPDPINKRMDFLTSLDTATLLSKSQSFNGRDAQIYAENNGYQESFIQVLQKERVLVEGINSRIEKRIRLSFAGTIVKPGKVLFPKTGTEELVAQIVGFGTEQHDDLADAFSLVIGECIRRNSKPPQMPTVGGRPRIWPDGTSDFGISRNTRF